MIFLGTLSNMTKRVSIQGYEGSFHELAARRYLGKDVSVIPCDTFSQVVKIAEDQKSSDGGFMAIENSIAGSILPNYALLQKSHLLIAGEIYLQIDQHLMVNPGVTLNDIREVHSHPMALLQCKDYLEKHSDWKLIETEDTALSARHIHQRRNRHAAAIAGKAAAELYGLDIIASRIQMNKNNFTRFLFLNKSIGSEDITADKASISFQTDHSKGALAKVLTKIASHDINLSKLQSMPVPAREWTYRFYADMEFEKYSDLKQALKSITPITNELKVFGIYKKGITIN